MPIRSYSIDEIHQRMIDKMVNLTGEKHINLNIHPLNILAMASAGAIAGLYDALDDAIAGSFVTTANHADLDRLGMVWNVQRGNAIKSTGTVLFTGTAGAIIPAGSQADSANGIAYQTDEETIIADDGTAIVNFTAIQAGSDGNILAGQELSWQAPIDAVASYGIVTADGMQNGSDAEADYLYRQRILLQLRKPNKNGTASDYILWGLAREAHEIPVSKIFVAGADPTPGQVTLYMLVENDDGDLLASPTQTQMNKVKDYIDTQRPVGVKVNMKTPALEKAPITINGLITEPAFQESQVHDNIETELTALFLRHAKLGGSINLSDIYQTINQTAGVQHFNLTKPTDNLTPTNNQAILKLGGVIFT